MKRSVARLRLLVALLVIAASSTVLLQAVQSLAASASRELVTAVIDSAPPRDSAVRVVTGLGDRSSRDATTAFLESHLAGAPLALHSTLSAGAVDSSAGTLLIESDPQLADFATLTEGAWAASEDEGVLQSRAAAASGLGVGDVVTLDGALEVRIVGLWEPRDATAPHWFGEPGAASGNDDGDRGPLMVSQQTVSEIAAQSTARWTIVPGELSPDSLAQLQSRLDSLETALDRSDLAVRSLVVEGRLASTVATLRGSIDALDRLTAVPQALVVAISLVTLARVAALLWSVRRPETVLLRARGTSIRRLVATASVEALPIAALGALAGLAVPGASPTASLAAGLVVLSVLVATALLGVRGVVTTVSSRRTRTVAAGAAVLVLVAAAVSLWQFVLYTNRPGANPFGALAPALGILAVAVVAVGVIAPVFRALERLAVRAHGIGAALAVRHLARDAAVHATSVLLIVLSVGGSVLAAGYSGSATAFERQTAATANGGDVRVHLEARPGVDDAAGYIAIGEYASLTGASTALPALAAEARIGDARLDLVAHSPARDASIPSGTDQIEVALDAPGDGESLQLSAWLADEHGQAVLVDGPLLTSGEGVAEIGIPAGAWSLLAIEVSVGGISGPTSVPVRLTSVTAGPESLLDSMRQLSLSVAKPTGRAMIAGENPGPLPVVLTDAASRHLTAPPGATITLTLPATGGTVDAVVLATTPAVDGAEGSLAVQADLAALDDYLLRSGQRVPQPNEVWISAVIPALVAEGAATLPRFAAAITTRAPGAGIASSTAAVFTLGMAGAALIAVVGVAAVAGALGRERGADLRVLRALGVGGSGAARIRFTEFALATLAAAAFGVIAGLAAIAIYVPVLARTPSVSIDPAIAALAIATVACCLIVGALAGRRRS